MEEISDHAKNLTLSEDLEKPLEERVNMFYNFVKVNNATLGFQCKNTFLMMPLHLVKLHYCSKVWGRFKKKKKLTKAART